METIKLLIWDLDETFWKGTLSDGEITPVPENIELVKRLTDRGIVNSICSKNDYEKTKAKLEELGVWEYFVFPSIDWTPKGQRVKNIISDMNLRPVNCLFIDDNVNNLEEAKFAAGGGINVSLPDALPELVKDPAFEGKDDSEHSRLKQYKILEEKAAARAQSGSNEEFLYQSEIHVELIEDCSDKLVRIYEMIHRNNQLNFTKDRISQEEVDRIFTDPEITSGVVHVTDKYGDHGIIGCYAIKDGKALQLVFSCRILGMGVEQWVYAELGYPEIEVVGEVAAELNKTDKPGWINNTDSVQKETVTSSNKTPKLIVYGTCPLRPIWAYLQPKLPNAKFAEIDPPPCPLNLAVALKSDISQQKKWMSKAGTINNVFTFDREIYDDSTGYVLITLLGIGDLYKYKSKFAETYFYSCLLNESNADADFISEYEANKITSQDMIDELSFICEHLSKNTKLLILTAPEAEFPQKGKDTYFYFRKELNVIAEKIADDYSNVFLIDIRKYAKSSADFFEPVPNHYNRNIGFSLSNDILEIMGINTQKEENQNITITEGSLLTSIPGNAIIDEFRIPDTEDKIKVTTFIRNGQFFVKISSDKSLNYKFLYCIQKDRYTKSTSEITCNLEYQATAFDTGMWFSRITVYSIADNTKICDFRTKSISIDQYNYTNFIDISITNNIEFKQNLQNYFSLTARVNSMYETFSSQISLLASFGINFFDYFDEIGIKEINIVVDRKVGNLIFPFLQRSKVNVRYIYTTEMIWWLKSTTGNLYINDLNETILLGEKDVIFFAVSEFLEVMHIFFKTKAQRISLTYVLAYMLTKKLFVENIGTKAAKVIAVRTANFNRYNSFNYYNLTANEKLLGNKNFIYDYDVLSMVKNDYDNLPQQLKKLPKEKLFETMVFSKLYTDIKSGIQKFSDISGKYVNITDGIRNTIGNPESYIGTVYIFGGPQAFGYGVEDSETIASYLQKIIGLPYRIVNYSNCWFEDYTSALHLIENTEFEPNDIVVFLLANWQRTFLESSYTHWLRWEAIEDPIIKVDAFPLFEKRDRPDYFLHRYGYTPECNLELAKLIRDAIYKNIKLFDIE